MKLTGKLIVLFISSVAGLAAADYFITGFSVTHEIQGFLVLTAVFTILQLFARPLLRLLFLPLILLTLGLFTLVINGILLWILDFSTVNLTIEGLQALISGTLILTAAHFVATVLWYPFKKS